VFGCKLEIEAITPPPPSSPPLRVVVTLILNNFKGKE